MKTLARFMQPIDIHFISWQRPKITELAIRTIARNTKSGNYRLVVFDNGSDTAQQKMLSDLHNNGLIDELILNPVNIGLERARTRLLKEATRGEYFICADNDCLPPPTYEGRDWIERLVDLMERYEDYAAISCRTQVMIGSGNIFEDETLDITEFPHPGGSLRIMRSDLVELVGGWREYANGRGAEERYICGELRELGFKTGFATHIHTLHLFGLKDTDRWGYDKEWTPEKTGHSDISHPALENGDDFEEVERYSGKKLTKEYFNVNVRD